jgi:hypothetical protein
VAIKGTRGKKEQHLDDSEQPAPTAGKPTSGPALCQPIAAQGSFALTGLTPILPLSTREESCWESSHFVTAPKFKCTRQKLSLHPTNTNKKEISTVILDFSKLLNLSNIQKQGKTTD